ncbi:DoxX family protein [Nocardia cyriacigeorgica]|uniref:DoxX family protein n=1 Tax=Nocardia cyriacigeorgica TaxID=135487 RepID=UPI00189528CC|nr:DoxX family protein [Nocardia cyriacigeorgica]MBF6456935.1 DoxX family protein [Nocardia cyriacigeorgica]MBF6478362.1 DoxX family protein [Nocardia cyriacigeorgica]MBF6551740.1 DoxX family protein [Nocardia cyriacigeorgica]
MVGVEVLQQQDDDAPVEVAEPRRWHPLTRIAFRFCFVYFGLFCLLFAQITFAFTGIAGQWLPERAVMWQMELLSPAYEWVGRTVFGVDAVLHEDSGSGDQTVIWVMIFCVLVVALAATLIWSVLDRRRTAYPRLSAWFFTVIRLCLAGQMLFYGIAKAIPTQMPSPPLNALLQPYGEFSITSVLWLQVGSSPAYQVLLGIAEMLAGLLLFWPRTATVGAMLSVVSMAQVFVLNMTFDVPVKILSFHLLLLSLLLLAPQAQRLANVLVLERPSDPATQPRLFDSAKANRIAALVQVLIGVWMLIGVVDTGWRAWDEFGGGREKSPLYGIWTVSEFTASGQPVPPVLTDENRWQRAVFDDPGAMFIQGMDGALTPTAVAIDADARTLTLTAPPQSPDATPVPIASFTFERPEPERLRLTGELNGTPTTIVLDQMDLDAFPLRSGGFRWVQDYPDFR